MPPDISAPERPPETAAPPIDSFEKTVEGVSAKYAELEKKKAPDTPAAPAEGTIEAPPPGSGPAAAAPAAPVPEQLPEITQEAISDFFQVGFSLLKTRYGEHWELQDFERNQLAKATKGVLDKYSFKISPETALAFWGIAIVGPRVLMSIDQKKQAEKSPAHDEPKGRAAKPQKGDEKGTGASISPVDAKEDDGWSANKRELENAGNQGKGQGK